MCLYTEQCPVYENWVKQTKDKRLNIIQKIPGESSFSCLAYEALKDFETGIAEGKLEGRAIGDDCSHVTSLNLSRVIMHKLGYNYV